MLRLLTAAEIGALREPNRELRLKQPAAVNELKRQT